MTGNQDRFQQAMNQGHSAAWDQAWDKAAKYYTQALAEFPDHPKALTSLALALFELQDYSTALDYYQRAANISTNDPIPLEKVAELSERMGNLSQAIRVYMQVAEMYAQNRDVDKAIENWTSVVSLNPEHIPAHSRLALVFERLGRKQQSIMEYIAIASLMQHKGNVQKAIQTVNHMLQIFPDSNEARQAMSMIQNGKLLPKPRRPRGVTGPLMMAQVRQLEAPETDEKRPRLDPIQDARQAALTILASILFETVNEEEEIQVKHGLASLVKGTGILGQQVDQTKIMLHLSQAIDMQSRGENSPAITELERAIDAGLDTPAVYFDLGLLLSSGDRLESAIRNLHRAVKHTSFALGAHLLLGETYRKLERWKEASIKYLEALKIADSECVSPDQAEELVQLYDPIIEAFSQHSQEKLQVRLCENIGQMLMRTDWRDILKSARQQLPEQPANAQPMPLAEMLTEASSSQVVESLSKVHSLARSGKLRTAMEEAFSALTYAPTYLPLHITIGDLLIQESRVAEAVTKFTVIGESYNARGETNRAIGMFKRVSELSPMDMDARNRLIDLMMTRGQVEDTIREFLKLAETYYSMADLGMARKTYTRALRYAQQANIDRNGKISILHRMADIDMQSLDWRQALRVFEQIRTMEPDDEKARSIIIDLNLRLGQASQSLAELDNYLAHLLNSGKNQEALDFLINLVEENAKQPAMHRRLGELYRQLGRAQEAIEQLDLASNLFLLAGNQPAAMEAIAAILVLNPPNVADYQRKLTDLKDQ